ncbi:MAG: hypothetical protein MHPSP_004499, partial [Paramarteilia canceri]
PEILYQVFLSNESYDFLIDLIPKNFLDNLSPDQYDLSNIEDDSTYKVQFKENGTILSLKKIEK